MKKLIAIVVAVVVVKVTHALNAELRALRAEWDPTDPFNSDWQGKLHAYAEKVTDEEAFTTSVEDGEERRDPSTDVLELDEAKFREVFINSSSNPPEKPWFVAFIRKNRSQTSFF